MTISIFYANSNMTWSAHKSTQDVYVRVGTWSKNAVKSKSQLFASKSVKYLYCCWQAFSERKYFPSCLDTLRLTMHIKIIEIAIKISIIGVLSKKITWSEFLHKIYVPTLFSKTVSNFLSALLIILIRDIEWI